MLDRMEKYTVEDILVAQQPEWKKPAPSAAPTTPKKSEKEPVIVTKDGFTVINTNTKRKNAPATPKSNAPVVTPKKDNKREELKKSYGNSFDLLSDE